MSKWFIVFFIYCRHYAAQIDNPASKWSLPESFAVVYTNIEGELIISGVFLRLYIANPGWVLRKPKEFIVELLEKWSEVVSIANPNVSHCLLIGLAWTYSKLILVCWHAVKHQSINHSAISLWENVKCSLLSTVHLCHSGRAMQSTGHKPKLFCQYS